MHRKQAWLLIAAGAVATADAASSAVQDNAALSREVEAALIRADQSGALPATGGMRISSAARIRYELGAVVNSQAGAGPGVAVLAVTPGSAAERAALRPGDRLITVNGRALAAGADAYESLRRSLDAGNGKARLEWLRSGQRQSASVDADPVAVPGYSLTVDAPSGCGFVSDQQGIVPRLEGIHRAQLTKIDGKSTPLEPQYRHEVSAGRHVLTFAPPRIEWQFLTHAQRRYIHLSERTAHTRSYKTLVVDVKPDTVLRLAVRLHKDKLDEASIRRFEYWEPFVWEERAEKCR